MTDMEVIEGTIVESARALPAVVAHQAMVTRAEVTVDDVIAQRGKIKEVMTQVMTDGIHYGRIPGIAKPTLFKAGAEVLNTTFRLAPSYQSERIFHDDGHLTVIAKCILTHAPSGMVLAEGEGLCSSRELKYGWRAAGRSCPNCGAEAIIKGKQEYGGGWLCWKNHKTSPGCGAKFAAGDQRIEGQPTGRVKNPDLPDTWNTVLKMADKRALVAAVLNGTAASDIFTQDVEENAATARSKSSAKSTDEYWASVDAGADGSVGGAGADGIRPEASPADDLGSGPRAIDEHAAVDSGDAAPAGGGDDHPRPSDPDVPPLASEAQRRKLNVLVGTLREKGHITTEDLYAATGRDAAFFLREDGTLHWSELRDELTKKEASDLIERLDAYEKKVAA